MAMMMMITGKKNMMKAPNWDNFLTLFYFTVEVSCVSGIMCFVLSNSAKVFFSNNPCNLPFLVSTSSVRLSISMYDVRLRIRSRKSMSKNNQEKSAFLPWLRCTSYIHGVQRHTTTAYSVQLSLQLTAKYHCV